MVSLLRALPYLKALRTRPSDGHAVLEVGFNPQDWLAYLAMVRQVADRGAFFFENPFTTEPQSGRFVLLFHWLMGSVSAVTGLQATTVLELSRVVLIFGFFAVLWWFLEPFLSSRTERLWATALIGLGGGLDVWVRPLAGFLPVPIGSPLLTATSQLYGWSTFGAMYNPLWIVALTVMLLLLRPIFSTRGKSCRENLLLGLGLALLWWIHPYSAVAMVAISCSHWAARALRSRSWAGLWALSTMGCAFALATVPVILWQRADPVFSAATDGFFGPLALSVLWYPLTFGALLVPAVLGLRISMRTGHEPWMALASWIVVVAVLHSSPIWNGYHFVMYQHIPLAILAAAGVVSLTRDVRFSRLRAAGAVVLVALILATPVFATVEALQAVRSRDRITTSTFDLLEYLSTQPAGNVLAPADLGNLIPAYSHHKVFVGHWFLTPDFPERSRLYDRIATDPDAAQDLAALLDDQNIDYFVMPSNSDALASGPAVLDERIRDQKRFGSLEVLVLRSRVGP